MWGLSPGSPTGTLIVARRYHAAKVGRVQGLLQGLLLVYLLEWKKKIKENGGKMGIIVLVFSRSAYLMGSKQGICFEKGILK